MAATNQDNGSFWTQFTPSTDTRLIFVSSSEGNDSNNGLTPATPVKTIARGESLLRNGFPDWMLLKRGDVWETGLGFWSKGGRSVDERMVVGAYGEGAERPQLRPAGTDFAMQAQGTSAASYLAFVGLHFEPRSRQSDERTRGIAWLRRGNDILFEDLYVARFADNFNLQSLGEVGQLTNIRINGCVVVESWSRTSHSQGIFASKIDGLSIENSVIASNGHLDGEAPPTIFNHNIYITNSCKNVSVKHNIIADASSHGVQLRPGGIIESNLFLSNPIAILFGGGTSPNVGGVEGVVKDNIVLHGRGISATLPRSWALDIYNVRIAEVSGNIFAVSEIGFNGNAISVTANQSLGIADLTIKENSVVNWHGSVEFSQIGTGHFFSNVIFESNIIWRDLMANNGDGRFNKSLVTIFSSQSNDLAIRDNTYRYLGMHNRPFVADGQDLTVDQWRTFIEPNGVFESINSSPPDLSISNYLASIGKSGGIMEFVDAAKLQSRQQTSELFRPAAIYGWARGLID
jgi:hypothetical protein